MDTELQQRRLIEAETIQQELTQKSDEAITTILSMEGRLKQLEAELETKQIEVEEVRLTALVMLTTISQHG